MTATDELLRLLTAAGVEYRFKDATKVFEWHFDGTDGEGSAHATEVNGGINIIACSLTPAQAIAATLGRGTCHMRLAYEEEDADGFIWPDHYECDTCGANVNGIMPYYDTEMPPKFCPNCGRKVVDE